MPVKLSADQAVTRLKERYPGFGFDEFEYINSTTPSTVICPTHGRVQRSYKDAIRTGTVCEECSPSKSLGKDGFLALIEEQCPEWGKYDYSQVVYKNANTPVVIGCPDHGNVELRPGDFKNLKMKSPCSKCNRDGIKIKIGASLQIEVDKVLPNRFKIVGDSKEALTFSSPAQIINLTCIAAGHSCKTTASALFGKRGFGCNECSVEKLVSTSRSKIINFAAMEIRFREKHGDKYQYDSSSYKSLHSKMRMYCREHGEFLQTPAGHLITGGCDRCGQEAAAKNRRLSFEELLSRAKEKHGDTYDYSETEFLNRKNLVKIICKKHGSFQQVLAWHIYGSGCPKCGVNISKGQYEIAQFLTNLDVKTISNFRLKSGSEIDIYCPDLKLGIEYNGLRWHSEQFDKTKEYHLGKTLSAYEEGVELIHIFEDEWRLQTEKIKNFLKVKTLKETSKVYARTLIFKKLSWPEVSSLLERIHLQGSGAPATLCYGLVQGAEVLAVMTFDARNCLPGEIELTRFCSLGLVVGGFTKLLSNASADIQTRFKSVNKIVSFSDTRLSSGSVYFKNGFSLQGVIPPAYWYTDDKNRFHRRHFQKQYLEKKLTEYDPELTEAENCSLNGFFKIWDCGKKKWEIDLR